MKSPPLRKLPLYCHSFWLVQFMVFKYDLFELPKYRDINRRISVSFPTRFPWTLLTALPATNHWQSQAASGFWPWPTSAKKMAFSRKKCAAHTLLPVSCILYPAACIVHPLGRPHPCDVRCCCWGCGEKNAKRIDRSPVWLWNFRFFVSSSFYATNGGQCNHVDELGGSWCWLVGGWCVGLLCLLWAGCNWCNTHECAGAQA